MPINVLLVRVFLSQPSQHHIDVFLDERGNYVVLSSSNVLPSGSPNDGLSRKTKHQYFAKKRMKADIKFKIAGLPSDCDRNQSRSAHLQWVEDAVEENCKSLRRMDLFAGDDFREAEYVLVQGEREFRIRFRSLTASVALALGCAANTSASASSGSSRDLMTSQT